MNEKWQDLALKLWRLVGAAVTTTLRFPAEVINVCRWPFFGVGPVGEKTPWACTSPRQATGKMGLFAVAGLPWRTLEAISGPVMALLAVWLLASAGTPASTNAAVLPAMASAASLILSCIVVPPWDDIGSCYDGVRLYR